MNFITSLPSFLPDKIAGDFSFFLIFVGGSLALAFILGKTRLINVVVFSYISFALIDAIPFSFFSFASQGKAIVFLSILILLVSVGDYILDIHIANPTSTFFSRVLVMGCLGSGLVLSILLTLVSKSFALQFLSPLVYSYFASPIARIVWMVIPLIFLLFINKRRR